MIFNCKPLTECFTTDFSWSFKCSVMANNTHWLFPVGDLMSCSQLMLLPSNIPFSLFLSSQLKNSPGLGFVGIIFNDNCPFL